MFPVFNFFERVNQGELKFKYRLLKIDIFVTLKFHFIKGLGACWKGLL